MTKNQAHMSAKLDRCMGALDRLEKAVAALAAGNSPSLLRPFAEPASPARTEETSPKLLRAMTGMTLPPIGNQKK